MKQYKNSPAKFVLQYFKKKLVDHYIIYGIILKDKRFTEESLSCCNIYIVAPGDHCLHMVKFDPTKFGWVTAKESFTTITFN